MNKRNLTLNIAPLIDVVLLLIIFFMLTSHFIEEAGINLTLPTSKTATPQEISHIVVSITKDEKIFLNDRPVSIEKLSSYLEPLIGKREKKEVVVKVDRDCRVQVLVSTMDEIRRAGAKAIVLSAERDERK